MCHPGACKTHCLLLGRSYCIQHCMGLWHKCGFSKLQRGLQIYLGNAENLSSRTVWTCWREKGWFPGLFFFFFFLSARGRAAAKPQPLPLAEQGAKCAHQPVWKPTFSRILPEGVTQRNLLQAPVACWMLCKQLTDTEKGTPA